MGRSDKRIAAGRAQAWAGELVERWIRPDDQPDRDGWTECSNFCGQPVERRLRLQAEAKSYLELDPERSGLGAGLAQCGQVMIVGQRQVHSKVIEVQLFEPLLFDVRKRF